MNDLLLSNTSRRGLQAVVKSNGGAYLFLGPASVGKATAARKIVEQRNPHAAATAVICKEGLSIGIEQVHELLRQLKLKLAGSNQRRTVVIEEANSLTREAQNALLKILEEPPAGTAIVLIAVDRFNLLPTVLSRTQAIIFNKQTIDDTARFLHGKYQFSQKKAAELSQLAHGATGLACRLAENQDELNSQQQLAVAITAFSEQPELLPRLLQVRNLTEREPVAEFINLLTTKARESLRQVAEQASHQGLLKTLRQLSLLEQTRRYLEANGNLKFALDHLSLEFNA